MKTKILSLLMITFALSLFTSCEGPMGPEGPAGVGAWDVFEMKVDGIHWDWDADREVFYYLFDEPAITRLIADEGLVQVAINFDGTYHPLPYIRNLYDEKHSIYLTETVSYEYGTGWIRFNFSASDLFDNLPLDYKPDTHRFKVTLLW